MPPRAPAAPQTRGRNIVLNFDNADIETVIQAASEIVGFNYVLAPDVRGKVTVQTAGRIPQEDVFGVLLAILEVHGFTAVKSGNLYKIMRIEGARERAVPTIIGPGADAGRADDEIITQIITVRYASAVDLTTLLRPMISARGSLAAHRETNILIVTDTVANVRRLLDIVRLVDVEVALEELQIIPIRFADANELAAILNQLYQSGRVRSGPGVAPGAGAVVPPAPAAPGAPPRPTGPATAEATGVDRAPFIIAERRSNSLVIHARKRDIEMIKRLIEQLDQNIYSGRRVFIYYAENAKSRDLATTLNSIYGSPQTSTPSTPTTPGSPSYPGGPGSSTSPFGGPRPTTPGGFGAPSGPTGPPVVGTGAVAEAGVLEGQVRFIADETTNAVIVTTYPRAWEEIQETIKQLDRMPRQVLIEVLVTEVRLTDDIRLGMDWAIRTGKFTIASQSISTASPPSIGPPSPQFPSAGIPLVLPAGGLTAIAFSADQFFAMITALAADNRVNVVSNPHILTSENKKAVINVSTSIPIVTSQQIPFGAGTTVGGSNQAAIVGTQSVEYRDTGVVLTVTPRIGERGTVALDVKQEVNDVGEETPPTGSLSIIKREAETSVVLLNNQTLVLGGLIRDRRATVNRGIPILKDVPLLGYMFGFKSQILEKTELLILITPRVVGTAVDAARVTDEFRRVSPSVEEAIRKAPRQPNISVPPGGSASRRRPRHVSPSRDGPGPSPRDALLTTDCGRSRPEPGTIRATVRVARTLIGMVHLAPLPGSPRWRGSMAEVVDGALADARALVEGGIDALLVENFGDVPFAPGRAEAPTVAALAVAAAAVRAAWPATALGINVLRNDARSALAIACATGSAFIRANVHAGAVVADQGLIQADAYATLRERRLLASDVAIFADVQTKHAMPLAPIEIEHEAQDLVRRALADALIVTGHSTGAPTALADLKRVRDAVPEAPLLVGSGVTAESVTELLSVADGVIVGTWLKRDGRVGNPVDPDRVGRLVDAARR